MLPRLSCAWSAGLSSFVGFGHAVLCRFARGINLARRAMREDQPLPARSCRVFMMKDTTSSVNSVPLTVCVAEDRRDCETGLKILLISINGLCLDIAVIIFYPEATQNFIDWLHNLDLQHRFQLRTERLIGAYGWNVKPHALLQTLKEGRNNVVWIDSDIIITKSFSAIFLNLAINFITVTEEALGGLGGAYYDPNALRARLWGFTVDRAFPFVLNTCVMRVTQYHIPLLERWKTLLEFS